MSFYLLTAVIIGTDEQSRNGRECWDGVQIVVEFQAMHPREQIIEEQKVWLSLADEL
jgi:hypothetical protein